MKWIISRRVITSLCLLLVLLLPPDVVLAQSAAAQFGDMGKRGGEFAAGIILASVIDGDSLFKRPPRIPVSPNRPPDEISPYGSRIWLNKKGQVECLKLASGPVFRFGYDKNGAIREVSEPDGNRISRNKNGREWIRTTPDGKKTPVYGMVMIGSDDAVIYAGENGVKTVYNGNGFVVTVHKVDDKDLITRVVEPSGRVSDFHYDLDGTPVYVKTFDGLVLSRSEDGQWFRALPGLQRDFAVPYEIARDEATGNVTLKSKTTTVVYAEDGVHQMTAPAKKEE
ncbi:MAG TPA: hypothetical protein V6D17_11395 [Candidatus Obscuribacterales bacterium]